MPNSVSRVCRIGIALQVGLLLASAPGFAQVALDKQQQKCVNGLNAAGAKVNRTQNRESQRCWKLFQKGQETSAESCWLSDPRQKVMRAAEKVIDTDQRLCGSVSTPPFAYTSAVVVVTAGREQALLFLDDLYGSVPDVPAAQGISNPEVGRCQQEGIKRGHQLEEAVLKAANGAKKRYLKGNQQVPPATDGVTLAGMITSSVLSDTKLQKRREKLEDKVEARCGGLAPSTLLLAFPGCGATSASALGICVANAARCRGCHKLGQMDQLPLDCDLLDDFATNGSCFGGPGPTSTPGFTPGPKPTVGPTPTPGP